MIRSSDFRPPRWLRNGHAQTLWPHVLRRPPQVVLQRETLELADGDCLRLVWGPPATGPVVILLHGLGGCARSGYILGLLDRLHREGLQGVVMQFRGASGVPNRLERFFHAGETGDLEQTVAHVRARFPKRPRAVVGFSMGGIVTLNWLANRGSDPAVHTAITVSTPLQLAPCVRKLNKGLSRIYQWNMVRGLKQLVEAKITARPMDLGIDLQEIRALRTLWDFDDRLTGPLHGFQDAHDYYQRCSPALNLSSIRTPTLLLHAEDDPFVPPETLPADSLFPADICMELSRHGGHVGFVNGQSPLRPRYWLEDRILRHLGEAFSPVALLNPLLTGFAPGHEKGLTRRPYQGS